MFHEVVHTGVNKVSCLHSCAICSRSVFVYNDKHIAKNNNIYELLADVVNTDILEYVRIQLRTFAS